MKKPIWKRWWFWALALVVVFSRIGQRSLDEGRRKDAEKVSHVAVETETPTKSEGLRYVIESQEEKEQNDVTGYFTDVIDGAAVTQKGAGSTATVIIRADLDNDEPPEDWEAVTEKLVAASNALPSDQSVAASIEALDGTVLLSVASGKVLYDCFVGVEEPQHLEITAQVKGGVQTSSSGERDYVLNTSTMKFHLPSCASVGKIKAENRSDVISSRDDLIAQGYSPCGQCHP